MKKLTRKLFLSVAALAVCAATLVSTTFAWYVVNPEAQVNGMTGSTAEAAGGASIYVSKNGTAFSKTVTLTSSDYLNDGNAVLNPITCESVAGGFLKVDGQAQSKEYIQFEIWVKSDNDATVTPKLTITNTTEAFTPQTAYQSITNDVTSGSQFFVDAVQALRIDINDTIYDAQSIADNYVPKTTTTIGEDTVVGITDTGLTMDAHAYYTQIMGEKEGEKIDKTPASAQTNWAAFDLDANTAMKFTFTIWLEGADTLCFDSCVGQSFTFLLDFTAQAKA